MNKGLAVAVVGLASIGAVYYDDLVLQYRNSVIEDCDSKARCWAEYLANSVNKDIIVDCPKKDVLAKNVRVEGDFLVADLEFMGGADKFQWLNRRGDLGQSPFKQLKYEICDATRIYLEKLS